MECNADIQFLTAYYKPGSGADSMPEFVKVGIKGPSPKSWGGEHLLPVNKLTIKNLQTHFPFLDMGMSDRKANRFLMQQLEEAIRRGDAPRGYCFHELGSVVCPDGSLHFLRGDILYPDIGTCPYMVIPEIAGMELAGDGTSSAQLIRSVLWALPPQALLVVAYTVLSSVRSLVVTRGVDLQAVMYVTGQSGIGKSRLVKRISNIYWDKEDGKPVGIIELSSTDAALDTLLHTMRDMPVMAEDMCLSTGWGTARKRKEQGARLIRKGTSEVATTKKKGNHTVKLYCNAGILLTAEFTMEAESDLNRCIMVPITEHLKLPDDMNPQLMGDAIRLYSEWIAANNEVELGCLKADLNAGDWGQGLEPRVRTNYLCLRWAFRSLVAALDLDGAAPTDSKALSDKMDVALDIALDAHMKMIKALREKVPRGNLAYIISEGHEEGGFKLAKKLKNLNKHDGILWQGDLCLRPEALYRFVRMQPGYQNYSSRRIVQELKDIGALVLQEEGTATVHLEKSRPRVYRIRLDVLKKSAKNYSDNK